MRKLNSNEKLLPVGYEYVTYFVSDNNTVFLKLLPDTEEVSESSLSQEFSRLMSVRYGGDRQDWVKHSEITDSIHSHCH